MDRRRAVKTAKRETRRTSKEAGMSFLARRQAMKYNKRQTKFEHKKKYGGYQSRLLNPIRSAMLNSQARFKDEAANYQKMKKRKFDYSVSGSRFSRSQSSGRSKSGSTISSKGMSCCECSCSGSSKKSKTSGGPRMWSHSKCLVWGSEMKDYPPKKCVAWDDATASGSGFRNPSDPPPVVDMGGSISDSISSIRRRVYDAMGRPGGATTTSSASRRIGVARTVRNIMRDA